MHYKRLLLLMWFVSGVYVFAQQSDSLKKDMNTFSEAVYSNHWESTVNPVGIAYNPYGSFVEASLLLNVEDGSYYRVVMPETEEYLSFNATGQKQVKNIHYFGRFNYFIGRELNLRWNDVSMISEDNVFTLGDSIGGEYSNEGFILEGKIASGSGIKPLKWGMGLFLTVGDKANQSDPRPEIISLRAGVNPGVSYSFNKMTLGMNMNYEYFKEEIHFEVIRSSSNPRYFSFKGFGINENIQMTGSYPRLYSGYAIRPAIQLDYKSDKISNFLEIKLDKQLTRIHEGSNFIKHFGDFKLFDLQLSDKLMIVGPDLSQSIEIKSGYKTAKGIYISQDIDDEPYIVDGIEEIRYKINDISVIYKAQKLNASLGYSLSMKKQDKTTCVLSTKVSLNKDKYNQYPDGYFQHFTSLTSTISGRKNWFFRPMDFSVDLDASYRKNLSHEIYVRDIELMTTITLPEFEYLMVDYYILGSHLNFGFPKLFKKVVYPYISFGCNYLQTIGQNDYYLQSNRIYGDFKISFIL